MKALTISEKNKHQLGMLEGRVVFAEAYYNLGDYKDALQNLLIAEQIDKQIPLSNLSLNMYANFGLVYTKLGEYDKAIAYLKKGLSKSNRVDFNGLKINLLIELGATYFTMGENEQAIQFYRYALDFTREIKNRIREQYVLVKLLDVYKIKKPDSALFYLSSALAIAHENKMYRQEIAALDKLGDFYKEKGYWQRLWIFENVVMSFPTRFFIRT